MKGPREIEAEIEHWRVMRMRAQEDAASASWGDGASGVLNGALRRAKDEELACNAKIETLRWVLEQINNAEFHRKDS